MLIYKDEVDKNAYGISAHKARIFACLIQVDASDSIASILTEINDNSWISKLGIVEQISYQARLNATVKSIMTDCIQFTDDTGVDVYDYSVVGEYIISKEGRRTLSEHFTHTPIPLAELWKEKKSGNPGFDYHSEAPSNLIIFGEAKYNSNSNPYDDAINQIEDFIVNGKDSMELTDLKNFVSQTAVQNFISRKKGFAISFSIHAKNPKAIIENAIKYANADKIASYDEYYIVGVQINDK